MSKQPSPKNPSEREVLVGQIDAEASRKAKARRKSDQAVWFGLGMMGLVGWSVSVPTLLGAGLGIWLDSNHPGGHSWTLALLVAGLTLGCFNAWHWVSKQDRAMHEDPGGDDE
ncbi:MAG: AtpZ/AtpI family protein [Fimbriimonas sp.]|nr:AtpZ/AtpI family protein [Fimbriimonas sp.]